MHSSLSHLACRGTHTPLPPPPTQKAPNNKFTIGYFGPYKVLRNLPMSQTYVLNQCGAPDPRDLPAGTIPGLPATYKVFEVPLFSVAASDAVINPYLVGLGLI